MMLPAEAASWPKTNRLTPRWSKSVAQFWRQCIQERRRNNKETSSPIFQTFNWKFIYYPHYCIHFGYFCRLLEAVYELTSQQSAYGKHSQFANDLVSLQIVQSVYNVLWVTKLTLINIYFLVLHKPRLYNRQYNK